VAMKPVPATHGALRDIGSGSSGTAHKGAKLARSGALAIVTSTLTVVSWDVAGFDASGAYIDLPGDLTTGLGSDFGFDTALPTFLTLRNPGVYLIDAAFEFANSDVGERGIVITADDTGSGATDLVAEAFLPVDGVNNCKFRATAIYRLQATGIPRAPATISCSVWQTSGANLSLQSSSAAEATGLHVYKLGPLNA